MPRLVEALDASRELVKNYQSRCRLQLGKDTMLVRVKLLVNDDIFGVS